MGPVLTAQDLLVRRHIYVEFVSRGHPPTAGDTATALGLPPSAVLGSYLNLHESHAIVLRHGDASRVRVAHPMSAFPTPFWVTTNRGSWWGNCIWDSLGIAAMLKADAVVETRSGASGDPMRVEVRGGRLVDDRGFVHIPVPARQWWDDIDFTCANILLFASAKELPVWLARTGLARGEVVPLATMWALANQWYGDRMEPKWRPRAPEAAQAILAGLGLKAPFWRLHP